MPVPLGPQRRNLRRQLCDADTTASQAPDDMTRFSQECVSPGAASQPNILYSKYSLVSGYHVDPLLKQASVFTLKNRWLQTKTPATTTIACRWQQNCLILGPGPCTDGAALAAVLRAGRRRMNHFLTHVSGSRKCCNFLAPCFLGAPYVAMCPNPGYPH